jgi:hypothetical protein
VELSILGLNSVQAILGVVLMYASCRVIDRLTPQVDFPEELKHGDVAVAIFMPARQQTECTRERGRRARGRESVRAI